MEIKFVDTGYQSRLISKEIDIDVDIDVENNIENISIFDSSKNFNFKTVRLQEKVLNSLNYVSNNKLLPSNLPDILNVKFIGNSLWEKIKTSIYGDPLAELKIPNTLYLSPQLLPENIENNSKNFPAFLNSYFKNKNQVFDFVLFHEIGHLIFNHQLTDFNKMNSSILEPNSNIDKLKQYFHLDIRKDYKDVPLYQINRSLEEYFADSYSSIILKHKYNSNSINITNLRNQGNEDLVSKGFNIDINRLNDSFHRISNLNINEIGIDKVMHEIFETGLKSSVEKIMNKYPYNPNIINNLQNNLTKFDIKTRHSEFGKEVIEKAQLLIQSKNQFSNFNLSNIENKLTKILDDKEQAKNNTNKNKL